MPGAIIVGASSGIGALEGIATSKEYSEYRKAFSEALRAAVKQ